MFTWFLGGVNVGVETSDSMKVFKMVFGERVGFIFYFGMRLEDVLSFIEFQCIWLHWSEKWCVQLET